MKLSKPVQEMLINGEISMGHARALLAITDEDIQVKTAERVRDEGLSVRNIEKIVKDLSSKRDNKKEETDDTYKFLYRDLEGKFETDFR